MASPCLGYKCLSFLLDSLAPAQISRFMFMSPFTQHVFFHAAYNHPPVSTSTGVSGRRHQQNGSPFPSIPGSSSSAFATAEAQVLQSYWFPFPHIPTSNPSVILPNLSKIWSLCYFHLSFFISSPDHMMASKLFLSDSLFPEDIQN